MAERIHKMIGWAVPNLGAFRVKALRGGADRIAVEIANQGFQPVTYTIQDILMWESYLDNIMGTIPIPETGLYRALGAFDWVPIHASTVANLGARGAGAVLAAGSVVTNNSYFAADANVDNAQVANGYIRLALSGQYASYNGPWTIGMWIYPTLISALTPIYYETNAAITHYMRVFLDTDQRIGFQMTNGVNTFSVKDGGGPQVPLNAWSLIFCSYLTPNFTYVVQNVGVSSPGVSVGAGGMATFSDANVSYIGLVGSTNGYTGGYFSFNNPTYNGQQTAPINQAMRDYISHEWLGSSNTLLTLDTASLGGGSTFKKVYGSGVADSLPAMLGVQLGSGATGDTFGFLRLTTERG